MSVEIVPSSERKCTNIPAMVVSIILLLITVILVIYCGVLVAIKPREEDSFTDACGYTCGVLNPMKEPHSAECANPNKTHLPKLWIPELSEEEKDYIEPSPHQCVDVCPKDYDEIEKYCIKSTSEFMELLNHSNHENQSVYKAMKSSVFYILIMCFVALVFSYVFLVLFRHAAKYVIWIINIGCVVFVFFLCGLGIIANVLELAISMGITGIILVVMLVIFRKRIALVAKLFKETSIALIDAPMLMVEPVLTFISLIIAFIIFVVFATIILLAGDDEPVGIVAYYFNIFSFIFFTQFILGCQNFIIAGAISKWYFTRDKTKLGNPIRRSFAHLMKFHLGSICFGAILVTIVKAIKMLCNAIKNSARENKNAIVMIIAACFVCIIDLIDQFLQYLARNAYIIIAKEGTPFVQSGKRAYHLLAKNVTDVIALNHFGDLVLFVCRILIVLIAGFVGYIMMDKDKELGDFFIWPLIIGIILSFLIAHCFVMVFEMTIDTIFVCFCIDCEENDGVTREFYMSESLKKIMIEMKTEAGGAFEFGPKVDVEGGYPDAMPMLPKQPENPQPIYPNLKS